MASQSLPCFYHPSTVIYLDDNPRFIDELLFNIELGVSHSKTFTHPQEALKALQKEEVINPAAKCLISKPDTDAHKPSEFSQAIQFAPLVSYIENKENENLTSVFVLDYAMPGMTGVELCQKLKSKPFKKILITGQADYDIAVDAFNKGIINRFIMKNDKDFFAKLNQMIGELQQEYFLDLSLAITESIKHTNSAYPLPSTVNARVDMELKRLNCISYCVLDGTGSLCLIDREGRQYLLLIRTPADLQHYIDALSADTKDSDLLHQLQSNEVIPYFGQDDDFWTVKTDDWPQYFYPATIIQAENTYLMTLVEKKIV